MRAPVDSTLQNHFQRVPVSLLGLLTVGVLVLATGCTGVPKGVRPVDSFDADRYLGKWYEIARLDHSFERGLSRVTAEYGRRDDGAISVVNRGYDARRDRWKEARAVARFRGDESVASLRVTFQWPFSGGYHVIALDDAEYRWAMVSGPTRGYLWILAREPQLDPPIAEKLVAEARALGYAVDELIFVEHD
ncbi:MAG: lipocalin family protein [Candidatus Sumerlaeia bacterium]|nr:lipocalin family protein [Candidatus Sumerlaeia bacterium]